MANLILRCILAATLIVCSQKVKSQCAVTASNDTTVCVAKPTVQLQANASGAIGYLWEPKTFLSDSTIANPVAKPTSTISYIVTAVVPGTTELVTNGDFESGNTGFSSSYSFRSNPSPGGAGNLQGGQYTINTSPANVHQCFANCKDKTSGSGKMMIVNGAATANVVVWTATITVQQNTDYAFSAWLQNITCGVGYNAILQFSINSNLIGQPFKSDSSLCTWKQFYQIWNSGSNTSATISIVNQNTDPNGNDFALDDISFKQFCKDKDTVTITINVDKTFPSKLICNGDSIFLQGQYRKTSGSYIDTLKTSKNCDSIVTTNLTVGTYTSTTNTSICTGDSIFLQKKYRKTAGAYYDTLTSSLGCDSIITTNLTLNPYNTATKNTSICQGDSIFLEHQYRKTAGSYYDTVPSSGGCDTIVTTVLSIVPYLSAIKNISICQDDSIFLEGQYRKSAGTFYDTVPSSQSCDTIVTTNLTISPYITATKNITVCQGDSIFLENQWRTTAGSYIDTVSSSTTCDSIITTNAQFSPYLSNTVDTTSCQGDSVSIYGKYYNTAGTYYDTVALPGSCNSIATINLTTITTTYYTYDAILCPGSSAIFGGKTVSTSGVYYDTVYRNGCADTVIQLTVYERTTPVNILEFRFCPGDSIFYPNTFYKTDTTFYDTLTYTPYCDSIVITRIREVKPQPLMKGDTTYFCDDGLAQLDAGNYATYLWSDGSTSRILTTGIEGIYRVLVTDTNNCNFSDSGYIFERCDPYFYVPTAFSPNRDGKNDYFTIYTSSNIYELNFIVFDRWGEIVFETNQLNFAWRGDYRGEALPTGVYHWLLRASGINQIGRVVKLNGKGMMSIIE